MADNITLNAGSGGDTLRTDDDGTAHWQYVKLAFGADNTQTIVSASDPLPVTVTDAAVTVDNGGTFAVQVDGDALTALQTIDNIVLAEDSAHTSTDSGVMALAVRNDTLAALAGTDGDYAPLQVDAAGALYVDLREAVVDSGNSTTSPLIADAVYTGTGVDLLDYAGITVTVFADQNSAANGMEFQFSTDNSNWDVSVDGGFDYVANTGRTFQFQAQARYFRVVFTNGGTGQSAFRLQTLLHHNTLALTSIHRLDTEEAVDRSAELVKAVLLAQAGGSGNFIPIQGTTGGNLKASITEVSDGLDVGAGNAGTETIRVSVATDDVNLSAIKTAVETIDNAISGSEMQVDIVSGNVTNAGTFAVQVDGDALTALQLIDDAVHTDDAAFTLGTSKGVMMMGFAGTQSVDANDAAALACDSDGALHISDGGNSITVDGSLTVDLGANNDVTIDNSSIVHAEDTAHSSGNAGIMPLAVRNDDLAALAGADGDYAPLQVTQNGALLTCPSANDDYKYAVIDDATSGNNTLVTAVASRKIRVLAAFMVAAGTVNARFEDGAGGTALTGQMNLVANSGFTLPFNPAGWFETSVNTLLNLELSGAVSVDGSLTYIEVP